MQGSPEDPPFVSSSFSSMVCRKVGRKFMFSSRVGLGLFFVLFVTTSTIVTLLVHQERQLTDGAHY